VLSEYDRRQLTTMTELLDVSELSGAKLRGLVPDLEALVALLENVPKSITDEIMDAINDLEMINALVIDGEDPEGEVLDEGEVTEMLAEAGSIARELRTRLLAHL
jgi:hypothetical protein